MNTDDSMYAFRRPVAVDSRERSYGNYPRQYLLRVNECSSESVHLLVGNAIGRDEHREPIILDSSNPLLYGNSFTASYGPGLEWRGQFQRRNTKPDGCFHCFAMSILTSQRIKEIVEAENIPNIEFIPMRVFYKLTDEFMADMWVINVFNWKDVFYFDQSDVIHGGNPFGEMMEDRISSRFGNKRIVDWNFLKVNVDETKDGLFLAKGPGNSLWPRPFISKPLADKIIANINPLLPLRQKISFPRFSLNRRLDPDVDFSDRSSEYSYAGWTGPATGDGR